jgi:type II secretory pathway component PulF
LTAVCCLYIAWAAHFFVSRLATFGELFSGIGTQLPWTTSAVLAVSRSVAPYLAAIVLIAGLIAKERSQLSQSTKIAATAIVYLIVSWSLQLSLEAIFQPLLDVIKKIQG